MFWTKHRRISNATSVNNVSSSSTRMQPNEYQWARSPRTVVAIKILIYVVPTFITLRFLLGLNNTFYLNYNSIEQDIVFDPARISSCTFDDLFVSFGNISMIQKQIDNCQRTIMQPNTCCWNLHEIIVRVPISSIMNRNSLIKLGGGRKGGVYKAIVQLKQNQNQSTIIKKYCMVAVKTDYCTTKSFVATMSDSIYRRWIKRERVDPTTLTNNNTGSCLQPNSRLAHWKSFLGGEYTGALIYYSQIMQGMFTQRQQDDDSKFSNNNNDTLLSYSNYTSIPGLLPTYGVITSDDNNPLTSVYPIPRYLWQGTPLQSIMNRNIIGTILPIQQSFESLVFYNKKPWNQTRAQQIPHCIYELNSNLTQFLQTVVVPTITGLQYVNNNLGLAYRDVQEKNIGIIYDEVNKTIPQNAFLYDHSYIGVADRTSPAVSNENYPDISCRYCMEHTDFPIANRKIDIYAKEYNNLQSEFLNYRQVVIEILDVCPPQGQQQQQTECIKLRDKIVNITSIGQFINTIQEYIKHNGID